MPDVGARQRDSQKFLIFQKWEKFNTRLAREAQPETEASWLENLQPVGDNNLVPVPAALPAQASLPGGHVTSVMFPANIGGVDYLIIFDTGGAAWAVNLTTNAVTVFASNGTFSTKPDCTVYAGQRILIADQTAGYCTWDGTTFSTITSPVAGCTTLAVFAGRVWIGVGRTLFWTGTAGYSDFNPTNASGSTLLTDADLSHSIHAIRNLNNYLFIFGDTSIRQIGAISVSGSLTLFTPFVLSSDIGTEAKYSILSYNRLVVFANLNGVYAIFGASVEKISDDLDGIFGGMHGTKHSNIDFTQTLTAALNDVRNIHCYLLLVRYMDPAGPTRSLILVFQERKWFAVSQGDGIKAICAAPLASTSQFETFASSGGDVTQLLQDSDTAVPVTLRTALSSHGNAVQQKQPLRAGIGIRANIAQPFTLQVETENTAHVLHLVSGAQVIWVNNAGGIVTWLNNSSAIVSWGAAGYGMPYAYCDGSGKFLGATVKGAFSNCVINMLAIEYQERALWGSAQ